MASTPTSRAHNVAPCRPSLRGSAGVTRGTPTGAAHAATKRGRFASGPDSPPPSQSTAPSEALAADNETAGAEVRASNITCGRPPRATAPTPSTATCPTAPWSTTPSESGTRIDGAAAAQARPTGTRPRPLRCAPRSDADFLGRPVALGAPTTANRPTSVSRRSARLSVAPTGVAGRRSPACRGKYCSSSAVATSAGSPSLVA